MTRIKRTRNVKPKVIPDDDAPRKKIKVIAF